MKVSNVKAAPPPYSFWFTGKIETELIDVEWLTSKLVSPFLAVFDVIIITPLLASAPYKAVAAAPLRTEILSILSTFISDIEYTLTPSTTYSIFVSPLKRKNPLSKVELEPPIIWTPATLPVNAMLRSTCLLSAITSPPTVCWEKPSDFFSLEIPRAVTTTSSKALDGERLKFKVVDAPTEPDADEYPTKLTTKTSPSEASME